MVAGWGISEVQFTGHVNQITGHILISVGILHFICYFFYLSWFWPGLEEELCGKACSFWRISNSTEIEKLLLKSSLISDVHDAVSLPHLRHHREKLITKFYWCISWPPLHHKQLTSQCLSSPSFRDALILISCLLLPIINVKKSWDWLEN